MGTVSSDEGANDRTRWSFAPFVVRAIHNYSIGQKPSERYVFGYSLTAIILATVGLLVTAVGGGLLTKRDSWYYQLNKPSRQPPDRHRPDLALWESVTFLISIVHLLVTAGSLDTRAGWALTPYLFWVSFATVLNATIVRLNPAPDVLRPQS
jgi:tryptophan-rich sensory protein